MKFRSNQTMREFESTASLLLQRLLMLRNGPLSNNSTLADKLDKCIRIHHDMLVNYYFYPRPKTVTKFCDACTEVCTYYNQLVRNNSDECFRNVDNTNMNDLLMNVGSLSHMFTSEVISSMAGGAFFTSLAKLLSTESFSQFQDIFMNDFFKKCTAPLANIGKLLSDLVTKVGDFLVRCGLKCLQPLSSYIVVVVLWMFVSGVLLTFFPEFGEKAKGYSQSAFSAVAKCALQNMVNSTMTNTGSAATLIQSK